MLLQAYQIGSITSLACSILLAMIGCNTGPDNTRPAYDQYRFDESVIQKLPLYDSLATVILQKLPLFKNLNGNDSVQPFRYGPESTEPEIFKRLPPGMGDDIDYYFNRLGKEFITGFDAFHDSTIKIYIRDFSSDSLGINTEERLSYYPERSKMKEREFPFKDTVLNTRWQYWARFSKEEFF